MSDPAVDAAVRQMMAGSVGQQQAEQNARQMSIQAMGAELTASCFAAFNPEVNDKGHVSECFDAANEIAMAIMQRWGFQIQVRERPKAS